MPKFQISERIGRSFVYDYDLFISKCRYCIDVISSFDSYYNATVVTKLLFNRDKIFTNVFWLSVLDLGKDF